MRKSLFRTGIAVGTVWAAASGLMNRIQAMQVPAAGEKEIVLVVNDDEGEEKHEQIVAPKYWLGITLRPVDGDLATYLGSSEGILVDSVLPESPAASAGLSKGDILVEVGDSKLADPKALHEQMMSIKATEDGKVTSLKFKVLRKGEKVTVEVAPVERPADLEKLGVTVNIEGEELGDEAKILTLDLRDKSAADIEKMVEGGLRVFRFGQPAAWLQGEENEESGEKKDKSRVEVRHVNEGKEMAISIQRENDGPAKITVKRDGETKEYTSDNMDAMPEDIRKIVKDAMESKAGGVKVHGLRLETKKSGDGEKKGEADKPGQVRERIAIVRPDGVKIEMGELMKQQGLHKELAEKYRAMAEEMAARSREQAKWATEVAGAPNQIKELQAQVESLRAELKELRQQLKAQESSDK